jgi:hypothetical protein
MQLNRTLHIAIIILCFAIDVAAQAQSNLPRTNTDSIVVSDKGNFPKIAKEVLDHVQIGGYYRFVTNVRHLSKSYEHLSDARNNIFVGDDAQIPQLMLQLTGNASSNTLFGTDLFLWSPMTGQGQAENVKGLNLGVSLYGNFTTRLGEFNVRTGGINWYTLSPFTFQANKGYNRYSLYERNPWDPATTKVDTRYSDFYNSGAINQDQRWGNQAFQGLILEGNKLKNGFSFSTMYGKTQLDGGMSPVPNASYGGKLKKSLGNFGNFISVNSFNNISQVDSVRISNTAGFNIASVQLQYQLQRVKIEAELGAGRRTVNDSATKFGEALSVKLSTNVVRKIPVEIHLYRISPKVFNNSGVFINSAIQQTTQISGGNQPVLLPVSSAVLPVGQLANNRQGIDLNAQIDIGRVKNSIGYANAAEIENLSNAITYSHPFNSIALSHFWRWNFPSNVGPYQNLNKIYRNVIETARVTDVDSSGLPISKKYFNTVEINSKYKTKLLHRDLYIFYLGSFNSVANKWAPITNFTNKSLLRAYDHQLEMYWTISNILVWNNYVGFERVVANYKTQVDDNTKRPKNQTGYSFATGFDINLSKNVGLYLRQRWMDYRDANFEKDQYRGWESTVELKAFF